MFRAFRSTRRPAHRFALALALASGAVLGSTAIYAPAAYAQNSRAFGTAYQPVAALVTGETPDFAAARELIPSLVAAIENEDDRNIAGNVILNIGQNLSDPALQRQGLEMMIASGKVDPARLGLFHFFVGSLAFNAEDYAASRAALEAALAAGYVDEDAEPGNDPEYIIMQSHLEEANPSAALHYLMSLASTRSAAGQTVPERWLLLGLQEAYDNEMITQATDISALLVTMHPGTQNWINTLQVVNALNDFPKDARIDLARLMAETNSLTQRTEFVRYIEDLDPRIMSNEVLDVLSAGITAGEFESDDPYYVEVSGIANQRAPQDRNGVAALVRDGESGDAIDAMSTADVLFSLKDFAQAERFYQLALDRGADRNIALTRLGMAQVKQGNFAAAQETLAQVTGQREAIARLWSVYASIAAN